jgi:hypothetical protein
MSLTARIGSSGGAEREQAARAATRVSKIGKVKDRGMAKHLKINDRLVINLK